MTDQTDEPARGPDEHSSETDDEADDSAEESETGRPFVDWDISHSSRSRPSRGSKPSGSTGGDTSETDGASETNGSSTTSDTLNASNTDQASNPDQASDTDHTLSESETGETNESSRTHGTDNASNTDQAEDASRTPTRERDQVAMYLPPELKAEWNDLHKRLDAISKLNDNGPVAKNEDFAEEVVRFAVENRDEPARRLETGSLPE